MAEFKKNRKMQSGGQTEPTTKVPSYAHEDFNEAQGVFDFDNALDTVRQDRSLTDSYRRMLERKILKAKEARDGKEIIVAKNDNGLAWGWVDREAGEGRKGGVADDERKAGFGGKGFAGLSGDRFDEAYDYMVRNELVKFNPVEIKEAEEDVPPEETGEAGADATQGKAEATGDSNTTAAGSLSFDDAFAQAREAGSSTFEWTNPETGKTGTYTTELASQENKTADPASAAAPEQSPTQPTSTKKDPATGEAKPSEPTIETDPRYNTPERSIDPKSVTPDPNNLPEDANWWDAYNYQPITEEEGASGKVSMLRVNPKYWDWLQKNSWGLQLNGYDPAYITADGEPVYHYNVAGSRGFKRFDDFGGDYVKGPVYKLEKRVPTYGGPSGDLPLYKGVYGPYYKKDGVWYYADSDQPIEDEHQGNFEDAKPRYRRVLGFHDKDLNFNALKRDYRAGKFQLGGIIQGLFDSGLAQQGMSMLAGQLGKSKSGATGGTGASTGDQIMVNGIPYVPLNSMQSVDKGGRLIQKAQNGDPLIDNLNSAPVVGNQSGIEGDIGVEDWMTTQFNPVADGTSAVNNSVDGGAKANLKPVANNTVRDPQTSRGISYDPSLAPILEYALSKPQSVDVPKIPLRKFQPLAVMNKKGLSYEERAAAERDFTRMSGPVGKSANPALVSRMAAYRDNAAAQVTNNLNNADIQERRRTENIQHQEERDNQRASLVTDNANRQIIYQNKLSESQAELEEKLLKQQRRAELVKGIYNDYVGSREKQFGFERADAAEGHQMQMNELRVQMRNPDLTPEQRLAIVDKMNELQEGFSTGMRDLYNDHSNTGGVVSTVRSLIGYENGGKLIPRTEKFKKGGSTVEAAKVRADAQVQKSLIKRRADLEKNAQKLRVTKELAEKKLNQSRRTEIEKGNKDFYNKLREVGLRLSK